MGMFLYPSTLSGHVTFKYYILGFNGSTKILDPPTHAVFNLAKYLNFKGLFQNRGTLFILFQHMHKKY